MAMKFIDETKEVACRTAEANAIRAKTGGSATIPYDFQNEKGFADAIAGIPSGGIPWWWEHANGSPFSQAFTSDNANSLPETCVIDVSDTKISNIGTVFNANKTSCRTLEVYYPALSNGVDLGQLAGGGGFRPSGIVTIKLRYGGSDKVVLKNADINYPAAAPTIETVDCAFDLRKMLRDFPGNSTGFSAALKHIRFVSNTASRRLLLSNPTNLTDDSVISIANAMQAGSSTVQLHANVKARLSTIMGTVSQVTDDTGTYDFFTASASGDTSLEDFITLTKGWTIA